MSLLPLRSWQRAFVLLPLLFVLGVAPLLAQSQATTGVIRGFVSDQFLQPIEGATIALLETGTNFQRTITSNENGTFTATLLPLGLYTITVRAEGYSEFQQTDVRVRVGATVQLPITLVTELDEIVVEAQAAGIEIERTELATRLPEQAVENLPNNGRNFLDLTLLTPGVAIVQGPDGDVLSVSGQRGIHNNVSVDGADFNNPFFGEQRGGQRPAFTFNLDAVEELVVVPQGANAEFGRSSGGFVNVITKSGTNTVKGTAHYYGKYDALSAIAEYEDSDRGLRIERDPDFSQHQFGFTLGGPIVKDKVFFFTAYDQQVYDDTRQMNIDRIDPRLRNWMDTAFGGALANDYGAIERTDDARAFLAKLDFRLNDRNYATLKYNHTFSEQQNGTFDVDSWARSANAVEKGYSNAINGSLISILTPEISNEFRFQFSREDRPRPYEGPTLPDGRPFPDIALDFGGAYRLGMPFFIPVEYYDTRVQLLNNVSVSRGNHLFKFGVEWNRVESVQTFIGFANGRFIFSSVDGFLNYAQFGNSYVECSDGSNNTTGACPDGTNIIGPVELYLQNTGVGGLSVEDAGTQDIPQHEIAIFAQDSWRVNDQLTLNYGLRWEAQIQPDPITPPDEVFFSDFIGQTVTNNTGTYEFPSNGEIPSDYLMFQPRFGFTFDPSGAGREVIRGSAGIYYARIPGLNLAGTRSTNGSRSGNQFRNSVLTPILGAPPNIDELLPSGVDGLFFPDVTVFDEGFRNPRTISASLGYERQLTNDGLVAGIQYVHASTDFLTRFVNRNDAVFGSPWGSGLGADGTNGIGGLTVVESTAKSRYNGVTLSLRQVGNEDLQFQVNYTLSWDKSDDDNERDPFTFRYAAANNFDPEYNWSDRDQRHRFNLWLLAKLPGDIFLNNRFSYYSAQPVSESCGPTAVNPFAPPAGDRAIAPADRVCSDGSILTRNTLRKDNDFLSLDVRISRPFTFSNGQMVEAIVEIFNLTNASNFLDPASGGLLFNFDGTVQSGLGNPRQVQVGVRYVF